MPCASAWRCAARSCGGVAWRAAGCRRGRHRRCWATCFQVDELGAVALDRRRVAGLAAAPRRSSRWPRRSCSPVHGSWPSRTRRNATGSTSVPRSKRSGPLPSPRHRPGASAESAKYPLRPPELLSALVSGAVSGAAEPFCERRVSSVCCAGLASPRGSRRCDPPHGRLPGRRAERRDAHVHREVPRPCQSVARRPAAIGTAPGTIAESRRGTAATERDWEMARCHLPSCRSDRTCRCVSGFSLGRWRLRRRMTWVRGRRLRTACRWWRRG